uniref:Uncharacterized protein n=1 Tax=Eimeria tenella TaxID=5802 RepID=H9BA51_EIMTE|nr:hypothetical protein [Eimeria tenella]
MAFENSETKTHVTAESAISSLEYQPQTFRTQLASRRPGLTRNIFAMSVVLTVLTFFITACAHHLKSYKNANTSSRKLAHQPTHFADRNANITGRQPTLPTYEEACGHQGSSENRARRFLNGTGRTQAVRRRTEGGIAGPLLTTAVGAVQQFVRSLLRVPPDISAESIYTFPEIQDYQARASLLRILDFVKGLGKSCPAAVERKFQLIFCGALFEVNVLQLFLRRSSLDIEDLRAFAAELESFLTGAIQLLLRLRSLNTCKTRFKLRADDADSTRGMIFIDVSATRPPAYGSN